LVERWHRLNRKRPSSASKRRIHPNWVEARNGSQWWVLLKKIVLNGLRRPCRCISISHWQDKSGIEPQNTVLVGFSQGSIMSLESTQSANSVAGKVIAIAGRFAQSVWVAPTGVKVHLIHGEQDGVVAPQWSIQAHQQIKTLGGDVTLDLLPGLGHGVDERAFQLAVRYLS
jgi:predicted esterase